MIRTHLACSSAHRILGLGVLACLAASPAAPAAAAQSFAKPVMILPESSMIRPEDRGLRAHTNFQFLLSSERARHTSLPAKFTPSDFNETPASLACAYGLTPSTSGCRPTRVHTNPTGGSKMIAIVDAYHDGRAVHDLTKFSERFHLPAITPSNFQVVYATGKRPKEDQTGGWELEESLDIEMAHSMAPGAQIVLVEANSNEFSDLLVGVDKAAKLVAAAGGGEVSMSWGGVEFAGETSEESHFSVPGVVFLAGAGDVPGTSFPAVMDNVVAVGGTGFWRSPTGAYFFQSAANDGGGPSTYVARPSFQDGIQNIVGAVRGTPDLSAYFCDALSNDPADGCVGGVWVYDTTPVPLYGVLGWLSVTGTSVATPFVAAVINDAGNFYSSSDAELAEIYAAPAQANAFTDIVFYGCILASGQDILAVKGWDFCTGVGTPYGLADK